MRNSTFLFALTGLALLNGCTAYFPVEQTTQQSTLHDLSNSPHKREVEIYFSGESKPTKPYIHLKFLSAKKRGFDDLNQLVLDLKKQGQAAGADAIIIMDREKNLQDIFDDGDANAIEISTMDALAIAYTENLQYEPGRVKSCKFYRPTPDGQDWKLVAEQNFDYKGQPVNTTDALQWAKWCQNWNHQYMMETPAVLVATGRDEYNRENRRLLANKRKVQIAYSKHEKNQIEKLKVTLNGVAQCEVFYHYQPDGKQIAYREMAGMTPNDLGVRYLEYAEFEKNGQLKGYRFIKKDKAGETPHLRTEYEYYSEADWQERVKELTVAVVDK